MFGPGYDVDPVPLKGKKGKKKGSGNGKPASPPPAQAVYVHSPNPPMAVNPAVNVTSVPAVQPTASVSSTKSPKSSSPAVPVTPVEEKKLSPAVMAVIASQDTVPQAMIQATVDSPVLTEDATIYTEGLGLAFPGFVKHFVENQTKNVFSTDTFGVPDVSVYALIPPPDKDFDGFSFWLQHNRSSNKSRLIIASTRQFVKSDADKLISKFRADPSAFKLKLSLADLL